MDEIRRRAIEKMLFEAHPRSIDYLRLLLNGPTTHAVIADELGVAPKTVRTALRDLDRRYQALLLSEPGTDIPGDVGLTMSVGRSVALTKSRGEHR